MGDPISLSMRGTTAQVVSSTSKPHHTHNPSKGNSFRVAGIPLTALYTSDNFSTENPNLKLQNIVIRTDGASKSQIDWIDKVTWAGEGVAVAGGVGLLVAGDGDLSRWAGTFMVTTAGTNLLLEWVDRRYGLAHDHRLPRLVMSLVTGLLVSNLVVIGFGKFEPSGLGGGDSGRNPTGGYGP